MALPRLLVADLDDPGFLQHFAGMGLTPAQEVELVAVLKRLALPLDQVITQGRATGTASSTPPSSAEKASASPTKPPPPARPGPPLSFFPPSPEALLMMTGMHMAGGPTAGNGVPKLTPPLPRPPPQSSSSAAAAAPAPASESSGKAGERERVVLVTLSRDRGGGARLFYPSRLAAQGTEAAFREEVAKLVGAWLLPLLEGGDGGQLDATEAAASLAIEWKPAVSYRKTVLRLTGGMPSVVLVRVGDGVEEEGTDPPAAFEVLVKGVV